MSASPDDEDLTPLHPPENFREAASRVLALEIAARLRRKDSTGRHESASHRLEEQDLRIKSLEDLVRQSMRSVIVTVAAGSIGVASTCIGVGIYVGSKVATLDAVIQRVDRNERDIDQLRTKVLESAHARAETDER